MAEILRYVGIGDEATFGVAVEAVQHLDINSCSLDTPKSPDIVIPSGMGRSVNRKKAGFYQPSGSTEWVIDLQTITRPLRYGLGGYEYTASGGRYTYGTWADASTPDSTTVKTGETIAAGATHIDATAVGTGAFALNTVIRIGAEGDWNLEFATCDSADSETDIITLKAGTKYAHPTGTPIVEVAAIPTTTELKLHEFYGSNDTILPSFTACVGKDVFEHVFTGCTMSGLDIKIDGDLAKVTAAIEAQKDSYAALKEIADLILSTGYPIAFYEVTAFIDTSDVSADVLTTSISIKNAVNKKASKTLGSRFARQFPVGDRSTTMQLAMMFEDTGYLQKFWGASTGPGSEGASEFAFTLNFKAADGFMTIYFPKCYIADSGQTAQGRDMITQSIGLQTLLDQEVLLEDGATSVATEILVKVWNSQTDLEA